MENFFVFWLPVARSRAVAGNCVVAVPVFFSQVGRAV